MLTDKMEINATSALNGTAGKQKGQRALPPPNKKKKGGGRGGGYLPLEWIRELGMH